MKLAKLLLVALALWMPVASFALTVAAPPSMELQAPCEERDTAANIAEEHNEAFLLPVTLLPTAAETVDFIDLDGHSGLVGHPVAPLLPPPNRR
ncbi:MAG: hypothetical protein SF051_13535 [Elusimicrobiota bacterium]|nr:hypothetical protein [Elusimicrobiota bacterium]